MRTTEQPACERLFRALRGAQGFARRRDIERAQVFTAERRVSAVGDGQSYLLEQLPLRRNALHTPAAEERHPNASVAVYCESVRVCAGLVDACEHAPTIERAATAQIERVHDALQRIHMIERASIGTGRGTIRDHVAAIDAVQSVAIHAVQPARRRALLVVHRAEPQPAGCVDVCVVEPIARPIWFDSLQQGERTRVCGSKRCSPERSPQMYPPSAAGTMKPISCGTVQVRSAVRSADVR